MLDGAAVKIQIAPGPVPFAPKPAIIAFGLMALCACEPRAPDPVKAPTPDFQADIQFVCDQVPNTYVYYAERQSIWESACAAALTEIDNVQSGRVFLSLLERLIDDLYDPHISLNTNSSSSPRLVPSGTDLWVELKGETHVIVGVRPGSGAARAGLELDDVLVSFNDLTPGQLILTRMHSRPDIRPRERQAWALNAALAGYRDQARRIKIERDGQPLIFDLGDPEPEPASAPLLVREMQGDVGYIRFNNSLGDGATVSAFNQALATLSETRGLILDLRDTPGGGNTDVAEPMLGRLIDEPRPYQVTIDPETGPDPRSILPIGPEPYDAPVIALVGRWTGSMGEGMAIGLDGMGRAELLGDQMAGLAGGTQDLVLEQSGVSVRLPAYDLTHLDGTPRHVWRVSEQQAADAGDQADALLQRAIFRLRGLNE